MKLDTTELQHIEAAAGLGRTDLYTAIHKALRAWMSHTLLRLGQLDTSDELDCGEVMTELEQLLDALQGHLETENNFVHTAIEARRPGAIEGIERDHAAHKAAIAQLRRHAQALLHAAPAARDPSALFLYRELALFVAENFEHMQVEETQNQQLLWSAYSDQELLAIHGAILQSIPPQKMAAMLSWMIPALNPAARARLLSELRANAPAAAFDGMLGLAQARLSTRDWVKLTNALGLPQVPGLVEFSLA
jgi:hemerythrin-like domain-containing protein